MRKIWDKFVAWLYKVPFDKWLHFIFGVLIASFFACALGMRDCVVPVVFAGFCKDWASTASSSSVEVPSIYFSSNLAMYSFDRLGWHLHHQAACGR